jgi:hypothetical protein
MAARIAADGRVRRQSSRRSGCVAGEVGGSVRLRLLGRGADVSEPKLGLKIRKQEQQDQRQVKGEKQDEQEDRDFAPTYVH